MAHQQTAINEGVISAQEFQNAAFTQRIEALEQRIRELEKERLHHPPSSRTSGTT
jgi:cell division protein FtsB